MQTQKFKKVFHSALYIDMKYEQLLKGVMSFLTPQDRTLLMSGIEQLFIKNPDNERCLVTISVRTFFDLALQILNYEPGTEILVTAINIPDMITIMRHHGLVPIPIEIDVDNLQPTLEDLEKAYKPGKTKALMVSYLYGSRFDPTEIFKWAKEKKLKIFEDEAESFNGPNHIGHELSDFTMFSFGTIKPFTAFGGAINIIKNNEGLYRSMKTKLETYDMFPKAQYFKKMMKNALLIFGLNHEIGHDLGRILLQIVIPHRDYKEFIIEKLRGFQKNQALFLQTFRFQIPIPMLYMLSLRMHTFNEIKFRQQNQKIQRAQDILQQQGIKVPGSGNKDRNFWLFPIVVPQPELFYKILVSRGLLESYLGATQLKMVDSPLGTQYKYPIQTAKFFNNLVYLPIHRDVPQHYIDIVIEQTIETLRIVNNLNNRKVADYPKL